ncbi:cell wall anchor protein, partial [[Pasteurella] aerogenes]
ITIPEDAVKDGSDVTATNTDSSDNTGSSDTDTAKDVTPPTAPDVVANDDGSVTVTPSADPDVTKTTVTYTDENGDSHTVTFTKDDSGNWV